MSILVRIVFWVVVWLLSLGFLSIRVSYTDGLKIRLKSWFDREP